MRICELHTLPRHAVEQIRDANLASLKNVPVFSQLWHMTDNIVAICNAILRSPKDVNELGEKES